MSRKTGIKKMHTEIKPAQREGTPGPVLQWVKPPQSIVTGLETRGREEDCLRETADQPVFTRNCLANNASSSVLPTVRARHR